MKIEVQVLLTIKVKIVIQYCALSIKTPCTGATEIAISWGASATQYHARNDAHASLLYTAVNPISEIGCE